MLYNHFHESMLWYRAPAREVAATAQLQEKGVLGNSHDEEFHDIRRASSPFHLHGLTVCRRDFPNLSRESACDKP